MFWIPIMAGAAIGALANRRNPLQGALLGAAAGATGGAAAGLLGGAGAAGAGAAGAAGAGAASTAGAGTAALTAGGGVGLTAPTMAGLGLTSASSGLAAGQAGLTASSGLLAPSLGAGTAGAAAGGGLGAFMQQNPVLSQMAMNAGTQAMKPQEVPQGNLMQGRVNQMQLTQMPMQPFMNQRKISLI